MGTWRLAWRDDVRIAHGHTTGGRLNGWLARLPPEVFSIGGMGRVHGVGQIAGGQELPSTEAGQALPYKPRINGRGGR